MNRRLSGQENDDSAISIRLLELLDSRAAVAVLWIVLATEGIAAIWLSRPWALGDNVHYLTLSDALALGHYGAITPAGFEPDAIRPPGYPALLWFFRHFLGLPILGIVILQLGAFLLTLFLAICLFGKRPLAQPVLLLLAISYPSAMMYGTNIAAEAWTGLALIVVVTILERGRRGVKTYISAGLVAGLAAYMRSDLLVVPIFISVFALTNELRAGTTVVKAMVRSSLPVVAAGLILLPYSIWNQHHFGSPVPSPAAGAVGTSLYLATWQGKVRHEDIIALYRGVATPRSEQLGLAREVRNINAQLGAEELFAPWVPGNYSDNATRIRVAKITKDLALKRISADPWNYIRHVAKNTWRLWHTSNYPAALPVIATTMLRLSSWLIFILGVAGLVFSFVQPRRWPISLAPALVLFSVPAVHVWLHTEARYTSSVRPILLVLSTATILWLLRGYISQTVDRSDKAANSSREPHSLARRTGQPANK